MLHPKEEAEAFHPFATIRPVLPFATAMRGLAQKAAMARTYCDDCGRARLNARLARIYKELGDWQDR